ncbi:TrmH family RNA methyltransferase [Desulfuribacillus alkaliarsenatis]|uniref:RNA 2-O ribose methyltransferase substrate binding domain-containing protein n=1 Tax=Desulfuribacillus alkaliarsenatis TaxID=766136 RepID=A0A1E5FYG8_9FIRM|nr:RNA methyltransferase [Desulfuribacillus alkaliarsenatis]OEF95615.1 hypothetical protein BHF68_12285 [Desulfuribacillus alkaliarsenatis]
MIVTKSIQSLDNPRIKYINKLKQRKYRKQEASFIIEGEKIILEALKRNKLANYYKVKELYVSDSFAFQNLIISDIEKIPVYTVTDKVFSNISTVQSPQGCLAVIEKVDLDIAQVLELRDKQATKKYQLIFLLDGIQDPGNVGTIIRTADAVGAEAVILGAGTVDTFNDKVIRSAMGSIFHVPVLELEIITAAKILKEQQYQLLAADLSGVSYFDLHSSMDMSEAKLAIVLGNEGSGLSDGIKQNVDSFVSIPMPGSAESLNVSVAAGIIAFDIVRQWGLQNQS